MFESTIQLRRLLLAPGTRLARAQSPLLNNRRKEMCAMQIETAVIDGTYAELWDATEDIAEILGAKMTDLLELTPVVERWLADQLELIEVALARHLDVYDRNATDADSAVLAEERSAA